MVYNGSSQTLYRLKVTVSVCPFPNELTPDIKPFKRPVDLRAQIGFSSRTVLSSFADLCVVPDLHEVISQGRTQKEIFSRMSRLLISIQRGKEISSSKKDTINMSYK